MAYRSVCFRTSATPRPASLRHHWIELGLELAGTPTLVFPKHPPEDWLQFEGSHTTVFMAQDEFADVYHVLQTESPVFFTALNLSGIRVGSVHTKIDLAAGQTAPQG